MLFLACTGRAKQRPRLVWSPASGGVVVSKQSRLKAVLQTFKAVSPLRFATALTGKS